MKRNKNHHHLLGRPAVESKRNTTIQESRLPRARSRSPPSSRSLLASTASSQDLNACCVCVLSSFSPPLSGCQCWDPLLGRARGKNKEKRMHERFPAARPTYESHLTRSSRRAPHTSKKLRTYFPTVNTVGYGKVLQFASFPTFGGSQKRRFALFYVLVFLSKHHMSVRNGSLLQWRICSHVNMK